MNRIPLLLILITLLVNACSLGEPHSLPTETPIPIAELVMDAVEATQTTEDRIPPAFPYSPAELAVLLEPGEDLEGKWDPSTVTDITRPIPGYACGGYYGSCWGDWAKDIAYGAQLLLVKNEDKLGEINFHYYEDQTRVEDAFQQWKSKWSNWEENEINPYLREPIGEQWLSRARHAEFVEEDASHLNEPRDLEVLGVEIVFSRCHGFVSLRIWFPTQTVWYSSDDLSSESEAEKERLFDLAYEYMRQVDERITPYACNP
jgi:hypothetical protein